MSFESSHEISGTADTTINSAPPLGVAFFDLDNTLMRGASLFQLAREMHEKKFFTYRDLFFGAWKQLRFRAIGESIDHLHSVQETASQLIVGHDESEVRALAEETYDKRIAAKIWPGSRKLVEKHIEVGRPVWLATGSPINLAEIIAKRLGISGALGTESELKDGKYTGKIVGKVLHGADKADAVRSFSKKHNIDLQESWAYSDSINDIPLLSLVGHPVAVNPDRKLRKYATQNKWEICDFRKGRKTAATILKSTTLILAIYYTYRASRGICFKK